MSLEYAYSWGYERYGWISPEHAAEIARDLEQHWPAPPFTPTPPRYVVELAEGALHRKREEFEYLDDARRRFNYYRALATTTRPSFRWISLLHEAGRPKRPCWLDIEIMELYNPGWTVEFGPCIGDRGYGCAETLQHIACGKNEEWAREEFGWRLHTIQPGRVFGGIGPRSLNNEPHFVRFRRDGELLSTAEAGLFPVWRVLYESHNGQWLAPCRSKAAAKDLLSKRPGAYAAEFAQVDAAFNVHGSWQPI